MYIYININTYMYLCICRYILIDCAKKRSAEALFPPSQCAW